MTSPTFPTDMLLTIDNAQIWDFHILDGMSVYPLIGRNNKKYILPIPSATNTLLNSHERRYISISSDDGVYVLTKDSRVAPKIVASHSEIAEEKRLIEEAKVCTFLKSSLSPEMSMLLRSNPEYLLADKIAKAVTIL